MATQTPSDIIQLVGRGPQDKKDRAFNAQDLERLIRTYCNELNAHYTVFSIIGAQSSGKSTLMNAMFNTGFQMLDQRTGRKACTKGIWAAICNDPRAIVMDIEGSDGEEHQDDAGFENQCALFGLVISDVIFFNINVQDIGRTHAASIPLLRTIFLERLSHNMHKTKLVYAVRDYNNQKDSESALRRQIFSTLNKIWDKTLISQYFELSVEFFPHFDYNSKAFREKCKEIIAQPELFRQGQNNWPVRAFHSLTEKLWKSIRQNERLDMPSYWAMASREHCEVIMKKRLLSLQSNEGYQSLRNGDLDGPRIFDNQLQAILHTILSEYDADTKHYDGEVAIKVKETLTKEILQLAEQGFRIVMEKFRDALIQEAADEIKRTCKETLKTKRQATSVVSDYIGKFKRETEGLQYSVLREQNNFKITLEKTGKSLAEMALVKNIGDIVISTTTGAIIGGASGLAAPLLAAGSLGAGLSSLAVAGAGLVGQYLGGELSDAAYEESTRKTLKNKVLQEGADDTDPATSGKGAHSGASSK